MTDSLALDPAALERLREWGGDKLASQMVQLFLDNSGARMEQIRAGIAGADASEAERGSHSLKSSAANVGAVAVTNLSGDIEGAAVDGDLDRVKEIMPGLEAAYGRAISELEAVVNGIEATE